MSPSTATRPSGGLLRGEIVQCGAHRQRVGVVAVVDDGRRRAPSTTRSPRSAPKARRRGPAASPRRPARRPPRRACCVRLWRGGERQLELDPVVAGEHHGRARPPRTGRRRPARRSRPRARRAGRVEQRLAGRDDGDAAVPHPHAAAPPSPARRPRASPSARGGPGPMFVITPTSGSQIAVSSAICPKPRIASSSTSTSVPAGAASSSSGSPISVLKFARGWRPRAGAGRSARAIRSFVDVLPTEPVTRDHARAELPPPARGPARRSAASGSSAASTAPAAAGASARHSGVDEHAPRARRQRVGGERAAVRRARRAGRRTGRRARSRASRSPPATGRRAAAARRERRRRPRPRPARAFQSLTRARTAPQRLARDRDVVERLLAPAGELLPLLVALAGDHDARRPAPRQRDRARDRRAPVDVALDVPRARRARRRGSRR